MNQPIERACPLDPLAALRSATAARHTLLDSGLPVGADDASLHDYRAHLRMLRDWLAPLADWLDGFDDGPQGDAQLDMRARQRDRLALIDADLRDRASCGPGLELEPGDPGANPAAPAGVPVQAWSPGASAAYRWGVCYVVEGAQLGGTVLYGRLRERLAPHPLRYLQGDPAGPGPRWRIFMQALRAQVRTPAQVADACAGACEAFDRILAAGAHKPA